MQARSPAPKTNTFDGRRSLGAAAVVVAGLAHVALYAALSLTFVPRAIQPEPTIIHLDLMVPEPRPAELVPPPKSDPAPVSGGGAPAAPSNVHRPAQPPPAAPELPLAPVKPVPEPELVIGAATQPSPQRGPGIGQVGEGAGTGTGSGSGSGTGQGSGPRFIQGVSPGKIRAFLPNAVRRGAPRSVGVSCVIRADTRLGDCRPLSQDPAVLAIAPQVIRLVEDNFRFSPPTDASGQVIEGFRVTVNIVINP